MKINIPEIKIVQFCAHVDVPSEEPKKEPEKWYLLARPPKDKGHHRELVVHFPTLVTRRYRFRRVATNFSLQKLIGPQRDELKFDPLGECEVPAYTSSLDEMVLFAKRNRNLHTDLSLTVGEPLQILEVSTGKNKVVETVRV